MEKLFLDKSQDIIFIGQWWVAALKLMPLWCCFRPSAEININRQYEVTQVDCYILITDKYI